MAILTQPWRHQGEIISACRRQVDFPRRHFLAMEMGTGKSLVAISLIDNAAAERILVLCPKAVLGVWRREVTKHLGAGERILVLEKGTCASKAKEVALAPRTGRVWVVVNYDSAWRLPLAKELLAARFSSIVCDESHKIKSPGGKASRFATKLGNAEGVRLKLCLTGTPMPHSPLDLYAQMRFLEPRVFGFNFAAFRARYAICDRMFPSRVLKFINQDDLSARFEQVAYLCKADDVLDLPEGNDIEVPVTLCPSAQRIYTSLRDDLVADVLEDRITATLAVTKLLRLQQLTSGFAVTDECDQPIPVDTSKEEQLEELLDDISPRRCVVVFCRFRHDLEVVKRIAQTLKRNYGELSGSRSDLDSHAMIREGIQVMGVQIQSGNAGVDLTRANYAIYYSTGWSLGDYLQSRARILRPGQKLSCFFYHLVAENTVDQDVYDALEKRQELVDYVIQRLGGKKS